MNSSLDRRHKEPSRRKGFTLVELLVSMSVFGLVLAAIMSPMLFLMKSNAALGNISAMTNQSRRGIDQLGLDLRSTIDVTVALDYGLLVVVEDPSGAQEEIIYVYLKDHAALYLKRGSSAVRRLVENVEDMEFNYYDSNDLKTSIIGDVKKIEVSMILGTSTLNADQTHEIRSARFVLRNRPAG